jgi:hypothetical protein
MPRERTPVDPEHARIIKHWQRRVRGVFRREVAARWPEGVIPPTEGGRFFRELSDRYGCPEFVFSELGTRLGCWPWTHGDILAAYRRAADARRPYYPPDSWEAPDDLAAPRTTQH